jgi:hypothetical protein
MLSPWHVQLTIAPLGRSRRKRGVAMDDGLSATHGAEAVLADLADGDAPIALSELPAHPAIPKKRGRRPHVSAVFRWASRGLRGHQLETARCGGVICTTRSALARFYARLSGVPDHRNSPIMARARRRELARAERDLDDAGL